MFCVVPKSYLGDRRVFPSPIVSGLWDKCPTDVVCNCIRSQNTSQQKQPQRDDNWINLGKLVACASTAAGGFPARIKVRNIPGSMGTSLIHRQSARLQSNFSFIVVYPLLTMRHPDNREQYFKSKRLQNQSAKIRKNPLSLLKHISQIPFIFRPLNFAAATISEHSKNPRRPKKARHRSNACYWH